MVSEDRGRDVEAIDNRDHVVPPRGDTEERRIEAVSAEEHDRFILLSLLFNQSHESCSTSRDLLA